MKAKSIPVSYHVSNPEGIEIIGREADEVGASFTTNGTITTAELPEAADWSDAQLINLVRCDPPDEGALDILIARYWNAVFGRCQMLTQNYDKALDLAQATWYRLLRSRYALKPDGNFPAYLAAISTNLFRDSYRAARRAGPMADYRLDSLDAAHSSDDGSTVTLGDIVTDLKSMQPLEQKLLAIDIDWALGHLTPQLREIVVARFIDGESCAEIGVRHGRTEQTVSGWVREALRQMKSHLEEASPEDDESKQEDALPAGLSYQNEELNKWSCDSRLQFA